MAETIYHAGSLVGSRIFSERARHAGRLMEPGMVISVGNCGPYLGAFGVRVEDTVVVTEKGYKELTAYGRSL